MGDVMPLLPPINELSRLNLPPLKVDKEGMVNASQLDHFTRTIAEWAKKVDLLLEEKTTELETAQSELDTVQAELITLQTESPRGEIGVRGVKLANQLAIAVSPTTITGITQTVDLEADRRYRITVQSGGVWLDGNSRWIGSLLMDGVAVGRLFDLTTTTAANEGFCGSTTTYLDTTGALTGIVFSVIVERIAGANIGWFAGTANPSYLSIEDIGPA